MQNTKYKPSQAIIQNACIGKALKSKYKRDNESSSSYKNLLFSYDSLVEKANQLLNKEELKLQDVKDLYFKLQTLEKSYKPKEVAPDGGPTDNSLAFLLCGGGASLAWCRKILKAENILKSYTKDITEEEINKAENAWFTKMHVEKAANEELKQVTYVAMKAGVDLHGDLVELDEIRKAKESFNKSLQRANLFHLAMTDTFYVAESYLAPCDMVLNDNFVEKGTWLMTLQVTDDDVWEMIKNDSITGISIGAVASVETLNKE